MPCSFGISLNASPCTTRTTSVRPACWMFCRRFLRALRVVLDRDDASARSRARRGRARCRCSRWRRRSRGSTSRRASRQHAQEPAVFLGDGQLSLVGGLDALEDRFDLRREGAGWCAAARGGAATTQARRRHSAMLRHERIATILDTDAHRELRDRRRPWSLTVSRAAT